MPSALIQCEICGTARMARFRPERPPPRFCSLRCAAVPRRGVVMAERVTIVCELCGAPRTVHASTYRGRVGRFCSRACLYVSRRGAGNGRWLGGITPGNRKVRNSPEYQAWRQAVFTRDNWHCVLCGQRGGTLHADHIEPFSRHPELRLDVSNGRTLCLACHRQTPSYLGGPGGGVSPWTGTIGDPLPRWACLGRKYGLRGATTQAPLS